MLGPLWTVAPETFYKAFRHEENVFIQRFYLLIQGLFLLYNQLANLYIKTNLAWMNK